MNGLKNIDNETRTVGEYPFMEDIKLSTGIKF